MDLLGKTIVGARREARSIVYRSALQRRNYGCYGFLLGTREEFTCPIIDLALVVKETISDEPYINAPALLESRLPLAVQVAMRGQNQVLGLFVAWSFGNATPICHF
jgi:hypothetical protein